MVTFQVFLNRALLLWPLRYKCMHKYAHPHTHAHSHMHTHMHTHTCTHTPAHTHTGTQAHTTAHMKLYVHVDVLCIPPQWRGSVGSMVRAAAGQTLTVNQLVDMEWRFGGMVPHHHHHNPLPPSPPSKMFG